MYGLGDDYVGTAAQNTALLARLTSGGGQSTNINQSTQVKPGSMSTVPAGGMSVAPRMSVAPTTTQPNATQITQQVNQQQQQMYNQSVSAPVNQNLSAAQIRQLYPGYAGWGDEAIMQDFKATGGSGKGGAQQGGGGQQIQTPLTAVAQQMKQLTNEYIAALQSNEYPEIDFMEQQNKLITESGIMDLLSAQQSVQADIDDVKANLEAQIANLHTGGMSRGSVAAESAKLNREAQMTMDLLGRQHDRLVREIGVKQTGIQMTMDALKMNYEVAVNKYESVFKKNSSIYEALMGQANIEFKVAEAEMTNARANLQTMMEIASEGGMDMANATPAQQQQIRQLEMQAGLPEGFATQAIYAASRNAWQTQAIKEREVGGVVYYDQLLTGPGGQLRVVTHKGGASGSGGGSAAGAKIGSSESKSQGLAVLTSVASQLGTIKTNQQWNEVIKVGSEYGLTTDDVYKQLYRYTNTSLTPDQYKATYTGVNMDYYNRLASGGSSQQDIWAGF